MKRHAVYNSEPKSAVGSGRSKSSAKRRWLWAVVLASAAGALVGLYYLLRADANADVPKESAALTITTAVAKVETWDEEFSASGSIEPWQEAVVGSQSNGLALAEIAVDVGDVVKRDQRLARFDTGSLKAAHSQLFAALTEAQATWAQAQANSRRAVALRDSGGISEQQVLASLTEADVAHARVDAAKANLAANNLQIFYGDVRAPDDGVISSRTATLGAVAGSGEELFRVIRQGRLEWRGELTAAQVLRVLSGQVVELTLPDGKSARAHVRQLAPTLNGDSRLGLVYADLLPGSSARAGMYASGKLLLSQTPALVVPAASVVIRDGTSLVATVVDGTPHPKVSLLPVVVGRRHEGRVEIVSGLTEGTRVAVRGAGFLDDGDWVQIASDSPSMARISP